METTRLLREKYDLSMETYYLAIRSALKHKRNKLTAKIKVEVDRRGIVQEDLSTESAPWGSTKWQEYLLLLFRDSVPSGRNCGMNAVTPNFAAFANVAAQFCIDGERYQDNTFTAFMLNQLSSRMKNARAH
jgi:hypothetical protein